MQTTQTLTAINPNLFSSMLAALDKRRKAVQGGMFVQSDATRFVRTGDTFTPVTMLGLF